MVTDTHSHASETRKSKWKYRLAYIFIAWIVINWVPKDAAFMSFIGAILIYPFAMSFLSMSSFDFFKRERTYLREQWNIMPIWGKILSIAAVLSFSTGPTGIGMGGTVISLALTLWIGWFIFTTVTGYAQKGASHVKDIAEKHRDGV